MKSLFSVKKPCANCPFRRDDAAISLAEGRLEGIINDLIADDWSTFHCHKTVHSKKGGYFDDEGTYHQSGNESMCAGAMAYLHKYGRYSVPMRLAIIQGDLSVSEIEDIADTVIDPI